MNNILILFLKNPQFLETQELAFQNFLADYGVNCAYPESMDEWENFLELCNLPADYIPDAQSGFCMDDFRELCQLGYIENTDFNQFECFSYQGKIFASPSISNLRSSQYISQAWYLFVEYFEQVNNCKVYSK